MSSRKSRKQQSLEIRQAAALIAESRPIVTHKANGDELRFRRTANDTNVPSYSASFTKGLRHNEESGLIETASDFVAFVRAIDSGDEDDFTRIPLGPERSCEPTAPKKRGKKAEPPVACCSCCCGTVGNSRCSCRPVWKSKKAQTGNNGEPASVRAWESQGAGSTFDLEGPDAQSVTMPPAPAFGSDELTAEMAEVYVQALLRDVPFTVLQAEQSGTAKEKKLVDKGLAQLNDLPWFRDEVECCGPEGTRLRGPFRPDNAFRGITPGDDIGPYVSQFLLAGNRGLGSGPHNGHERCRSEGLISYGAISVDQRIRKAKAGLNYMNTWDEWLDVQHGASLVGLEEYDAKQPRRFITTPRDLATYVHYDALYEAYLNACLIMLSEGTPFDPGIPFLAPDIEDKQQGFAQFGGPHILSLVTEVATRALKAVRYQKFNIHRRLRPEALAARFEKLTHTDVWSAELKSMADDLEDIGLLSDIRASTGGTVLLPMAFCEGSPMHASYGAGHATVAGACVTILKAFFDHGHPLSLADGDGDDPGSHAFVANPKDHGDTLIAVPVVRNRVDREGNLVTETARLTVEGELNKLASNISIGRDWAGVHYFTDYIESLRMGEQIALGILEEQKLTYGENFSMTVPLFDGGSVRI